MPQAQIPYGVPPYQPMTEVQLAKLLGVGLGAAVLLLVLYTVIYHRGRLLEPTAKWLHLVGLAILPLFIWFLGNFVAVEEAKKVAFCGSCHPVMDPYVNDLRDPTSKTLAAVHYQNRYIVAEHCYSCHVSYGLHGSFRAKMEGLKDVYRFYTATWELPIKLSVPYSNWNCLQCHQGAKKYEALPIHVAFRSDMTSDEVSCLPCHGPTHPTQSTAQRKKEGE